MKTFTRVADHVLLATLKALRLDSRLFDVLYRNKNRKLFTNTYVHQKMLADTIRCQRYHDALVKHVKPDSVVVDLGTGTGILAIFAAKCGAKKVYAIDHSDIIQHAEKLAKREGLTNIEFIHGHSSRFVPNSKVDILVHDQIGSYLFDEKMIVNIVDLRERVMRSDGLILPGHYDLFLEPVQMHSDRVVRHIWDEKICGVDITSLSELEVPYSWYHRFSFNDPGAVDHFLCEPESVLSFDLHTINEESQLPTQLSYSRPVVKGGRIDGFLVYFHARFDDEVFFTTGPEADRAMSWSYQLLRTKPLQYETGQTLNFNIEVDRWSNTNSWRWKCS